MIGLLFRRGPRPLAADSLLKSNPIIMCGNKCVLYLTISSWLTHTFVMGQDEDASTVTKEPVPQEVRELAFAKTQEFLTQLASREPWVSLKADPKIFREFAMLEVLIPIIDELGPLGNNCFPADMESLLGEPEKIEKKCDYLYYNLQDVNPFNITNKINRKLGGALMNLDNNTIKGLMNYALVVAAIQSHHEQELIISPKSAS